jgi:hypothetical protein
VTTGVTDAGAAIGHPSAPAATSDSDKARRGPLILASRVLPWLLAVAFWLFGLHHFGTPDHDIARYAAYLALAVVLPGTLVFRALLGSRGNLPEDLGVGAAVGLILQLAAWALSAATGGQHLLRYWPLPVFALFLLVPGLRRHWLPRSTEPLPVRWSWIMGLTTVALTAPWLVTAWRSPLPPRTFTYYQDLLYHLALTREMTRSLPFQVPQVAGETLHYHFLSDADMATASMISGVEPFTVQLKLWAIPICVITAFVFAAIGRDLTRKWWGGALIGAASLACVPLALGAPAGVWGGVAYSFLSPSQTYSLPLSALLVLLCVRALRGETMRWAWLLVFPVALANAGAKASAVPPIVAGLGLALLALLVKYRDPGARALLPRAAALLGLVLLGMLVGLKLFVGGGAGTLGLQPLSILIVFEPYRDTFGAADIGYDDSLPFPAGVDHANTSGLVFIGGLLVWWVLMQAARVLGMISMLGSRKTRFDPAAWLLFGIVGAAAGATFLLWHPSASQGYFWIGAVPFGVLLTVWMLARTERWRVLLLGLAAGAVWTAFVPAVAIANKKSAHDWAVALTTSVLRTAAVAVLVAAVALLAGYLITKRVPWRALPVALAAAIVGAGLYAFTNGQIKNLSDVYDKPTPTTTSVNAITAAEMRSARWLDAHAGRDDVVATNVHCMVLNAAPGKCDARAFWVAGLGGRRTVLESWGYTDEALAANNVNGLKYALQPWPDQERYQLNERVFRQGAPLDLAQIKREYAARWLFADTKAGPVSPALAKNATLRYSDGTVQIYELDKS